MDVITTGEQKNKAAMLENLSNVIKFVTSIQLPDGRNLALGGWPDAQAVPAAYGTAGASPLLLTKQAGAGAADYASTSASKRRTRRLATPRSGREGYDEAAELHATSQKHLSQSE